MYLLFLFVTLLGPADAAKRNRVTVSEQYELGLRYMKRGNYVKALEQFNRIRNYHRDDPHALKAELAIGDLYFKKGEWDQARIAYQDFQRMHPRHESLDYVVYRTGLSIYKKAPKVAGRDQTWTRQAVTAWSGFETRFPESATKDEVVRLLEECRGRLAEKELDIARFYLRRKAWKAVEARAANMLRRFPDNSQEARGLGLLALASAHLGQREQATRALDKLRRADPDAAERWSRRVERVAQDVIPVESSG